MSENDYKSIKGNWDNFVESEPEQIDEAVGMVAALGFLYTFLSNRQNAAKMLQALQSRPEIPEDKKALLVTLQKFLLSVENDEDMRWLRELADTTTKINPKQWVIDAGVDKIAKALSAGTPPTPKQIDPAVPPAPPGVQK